MVRRQERGALKFKSILWLAVLAMIGYLLYQVAPALMNNYELENLMRNEARSAVVTRKDVSEIRSNVWRKISELRIPATPPIKPEDLRVEYTGRSITISLKYTIDVNLLFFQHRLELNPSASDRAL
jgi:hypothetical protein